MKRIAYILSIVCIALGFASCSKDDVAKNYTFTVDVQLPEGVQLTDITSAEITVTNEQTGVQYTSEGVADKYQFTIPGARYNVSASYRDNNGGSVVSYNGAKNGIDVFADQSVTIELAAGVTGGLVLKEIYYSMVKPNGKMPYMRDQFWEIYNNSGETLYLDNCVLGILEGSQGVLPSAWVDDDNNLLKEYGMGLYTVAFKGDGKTYPLEPGKSVVVANQALNHTAETEAAYDPAVTGAMKSPVDLSNADFEVNLTDYKPNTANDNPDVPDMTVIAAQGTQNYWTIPYTGNAVILAKLPDGIDPVAFGKDPANLKERPDAPAAGTKYLVIPQEYVLDGINIVNHDPNKRVIRLRSEVDAGSIWLSASYTGKSIRRKVDHVEADGRVVYADTNNSANDFLSDQVPAPGVISAE